jgi:hypothetical protein
VLFSFPRFDIPFGARLNSRLPAASASMWDWLDRFGLARGAAARARLEAARLDRLAAWVHPDADLSRLALIAEWMVWFFQLDDQLDDGPLGYLPDRWEAAFAGLLAACERGSDPAAVGDSPLAAATRDLWRRTVHGRSAAWTERFGGNAEDYLRSYQAEARFRSAGFIPALDTYLWHRRKSDAMGMCMDLAEVVLGREIPQEILALPSFATLREVTGIVPGVVNDIFSYPKECAADYFYNAVHVVCVAEGETVQGAVNRVGDLISGYVRRFIRAEERLGRDLAAGMDRADAEAALRCAAEYRGWMRGFLEWSYESVRYVRFDKSGPDSPPVYLEVLLAAPDHEPDEVGGCGTAARP